MARAAKAPAIPRARAAVREAVPHERLWGTLLLLVHALLALWGAARSSVTFDENFHLPAGVTIVARGDFTASVAQPPLAKVLAALPALAAGARLPADEAIRSGDEGTVGESFMRRNADRYGRIFFAGRLSALLLALLLAFAVWRVGRRFHGPRAGLLALGLWCLAPDPLAFGGVVGVDLPTALGFLVSVHAFWFFIRTGRASHWAWTALAVGLTALTRFSVLQLGLAFPILAALATRPRVRRRVWIGLVLLLPATWLLVCAGYAFQFPSVPLGGLPFRSPTWQAIAHAAPGLWLPVPLPLLGGLDYLGLISQAGTRETYLLGRVIEGGRVWSYVPIEMLVKWPIAWLAAFAWRIVVSARTRVKGDRHVPFLLVPAAIVIVAAAAANLNVGARYLLPAAPFLCVWASGVIAPRRGHRRVREPRREAARPFAIPASAAAVGGALALIAVLLVETSTAAPWYLSFYNLLGGGPGRGDRIVNDSNVDWGQGLIAVRDEMRRRGIERIHLAYHGTTDPAIYGIDYVPYTGGVPGPESDWIAVSSYFFVGLSQRMMTRTGRTDFVRLDFRPLWSSPAAARPARCMYLFSLPPNRVRSGGAEPVHP